MAKNVKGFRPARIHAGEPCDLSTYDGTRYLGRVVGRKGEGFGARSPSGRRLGDFATVRAAADALSAHAAGGGR